MGPGFKYHIVTISAIFLALTVGLVVGSLFVSPHSANQLRKTIDALRVTQNQALAKNDDLNRSLRHKDEFITSVLPSLLKNQLKDQAIAVIQTGDYPDAGSAAHGALQMAGAHPLVAFTIEHELDRADALLQTRLTKLHESDPRFPDSRAALIEAVARTLAHGDSGADGIMPLLAKNGFITAGDGADFVTPVSYAVIVAGSRLEGGDRVTNVDQPLIAALQRVGIKVVVCESSDALESDVAAFQGLNLDVATVDNINTDIGRYALVLALRGDKDDYGEKVTAKHLIPATAESN